MHAKKNGEHVIKKTLIESLLFVFYVYKDRLGCEYTAKKRRLHLVMRSREISHAYKHEWWIRY